MYRIILSEFILAEIRNYYYIIVLLIEVVRVQQQNCVNNNNGFRVPIYKPKDIILLNRPQKRAYLYAKPYNNVQY